MERHAQRIAAQLVARGKGASKVSSAVHEPADLTYGDVQSVDVDSMELVRPRSVGVETATLWAMQQVDFQGLLRAQGFTGPQQAAALGSIISRIASPGS